MDKVTISKNEYRKLRRHSAAYKKFTDSLFRAVVHDPVDEVVEDFRKTSLYTNAFLQDLGEGLRRSSYRKP